MITRTKTIYAPVYSWISSAWTGTRCQMQQCVLQHSERLAGVLKSIFLIRTFIITVYIRLETPQILRKGSLKSARSCCIGMEGLQNYEWITSKLWVEYYKLWVECHKSISGLSKHYEWIITKLWMKYHKNMSGYSQKYYEWNIIMIWMWQKYQWILAVLFLQIYAWFVTNLRVVYHKTMRRSSQNCNLYIIQL